MYNKIEDSIESIYILQLSDRIIKTKDKLFSWKLYNYEPYGKNRTKDLFYPNIKNLKTRKIRKTRKNKAITLYELVNYLE